MFHHKHLVSIRDLSRDDILHILDTTDQLSQDPERHNRMRGKILATVFYESSTRTKISFNVAMKRLGGNVIGFSHFKNSSFLKGESFYDTLRILEGYCDIMALRAPWEGSAKYASEVVNVPVINAGDGANQHPTQTLLDLYTIRQTQGRLDKLKVGMLGDLKYGRTVHSLLMGLAHFDVELTFISPESLRVPKRYFQSLDRAGISYRELEDYRGVLPELDVLYVTRIQKERFVDPLEYSRVQSAYRLGMKDLQGVKDNLRIMHPLPRVDEIARDIDNTPYAVYFEQARNGVTVREAIIALLAGGQN